ncbi:MAG: hypothetical protein R3C60_12795 [Parvularculaceae bacterium]
MTSEAIDPTMRVKMLIALTEELTEIISRENMLLRAQRPSEIAPLQADKARLAAAYAQSIRQVAADRTAVTGAGAALIEELRSLTKIFEERADQQRALLDGARAAGETVIRAIAEEAGGKSGEKYGGAAKAAAAPIVVNENA